MFDVARREISQYGEAELPCMGVISLMVHTVPTSLVSRRSPMSKVSYDVDSEYPQVHQRGIYSIIMFTVLSII